MAHPENKKSGQATDKDIDAPRLTPQGRENPNASGEDSTNPMGEGAKKGQSDKAEGVAHRGHPGAAEQNPGSLDENGS